MQYSIFLLALTALMTSVSALTLPLNSVPATRTWQFTELKRNQSTAFGWQLAGAALDAAENGAICSNLPCNVLANAGLDINDIKAPACSAATTPTTAQSAFPDVVQHSSNAFLTMLTNAFPQDRPSSYRYLCDNIRYVQLRSFMLNDAQIVNATCNKGGPDAHLSPEPFTSSAKPNMTAVAAYKKLNSKLFAHNYAATASSKGQLKDYCTRSPSHRSNLEALQLDPAVVSQEICNFEIVPKAPEMRHSIKEITSQQFVTVVENMSNVSGWNKWLCQELDQNALDNLGLNGAKIKSQVCGNVKAVDSTV